MNIVVTGKDSYIGNHIQKWLQSHGEYSIVQLDVVTDEWKEFNFSTTDVVVHVSGIVHRQDVTDWDLYKKVNIELPVQVANKAKSSGVKQFVFMSSMAVYGIEKTLNPNIITSKTETSPKSMYGKSKLEAERLLMQLSNENFCVSIVRPPNVYGKDCKGNYISAFTSIVRKIPVIPVAFEGIKQSMIYIDNLCELIRLIINNNACGIYTPSDKNAVSTVELMDTISKCLKQDKAKSRFLGLGIYFLSFLPIVRKAYAGIAYDTVLTEHFNNDYVVCTFEEGMRQTIE